MFSSKRVAFAAIAVAGLVLSAAPAAAVGRTVPAGTVNDTDTSFLRAVHQIDLTEIAAGQLASRQGKATQVRDLGLKFVHDHKTIDASVIATAHQLGIDLPDTANPDQVALLKQYEGAQGAEFDKLWLRTQLTGHRSAVRLGDTELAKGQNAEVKGLVSSGSPFVRAHRDGLEAAETSLGYAKPSGANAQSVKEPAGHQMADHQMAGHQMAGHQMAGHQMAQGMKGHHKPGANAQSVEPTKKHHKPGANAQSVEPTKKHHHKPGANAQSVEPVKPAKPGVTDHKAGDHKTGAQKPGEKPVTGDHKAGAQSVKPAAAHHHKHKPVTPVATATTHPAQG